MSDAEVIDAALDACFPDGLPTGKRVIVCGGRDFKDDYAVFSALDRLHAERGIAVLINGGADGADKLAREWAWSNDVTVLTVNAEWEKHGRSAGPKRNATMLAIAKPDGVVAFPGGKGTADMVARAEAAGLKVWRPLG